MKGLIEQLPSRTEAVESSATNTASTSNTIVRAGIVGAGLMGRWHAKASRRAGGRVIAVVDVDSDKADRLAAKCGGAQTFSDVERMLHKSRPEVLHVCTPLSTHLAIAELAIEAGVGLIIEKPLTLTAGEAEHLYERAAARGVPICPVHQFIFQDGVLKARELLPRIGRVVHLEGVICSAGGNGASDDVLNSVLADILPHPLSIMQVFLPGGLPEEGWLKQRPNAGELRAFSQKGAVTLSILISLSARPPVCAFKIVGTNGTVHVDMFHGYSFMEIGRVSKARKVVGPFDMAFKKLLSAATNLGKRAISWQPAYPGLQRLVGSFYHALRTGSDMPIPYGDALAVARVRDILNMDA